MTICKYLSFGKASKRFFLFDTFHGIPEDHVIPEEVERVKYLNGKYFDCYEQTRSNFSGYPNVELVRGILPNSLHQVQLDKLSYVSIDLNNTLAERGVIEAIWEKITPGGIVILDDYGWNEYRYQYDMWNAFASSRGYSIFSCPTGQGILIKH